MKTNPNLPAFPTNARMNSEMTGLTKREYFAAMFMQSLSAEYVKKPIPAVIETMAQTSIRMADTLLTQLETNGAKP